MQILFFLEKIDTEIDREAAKTEIWSPSCVTYLFVRSRCKKYILSVCLLCHLQIILKSISKVPWELTA